MHQLPHCLAWSRLCRPRMHEACGLRLVGEVLPFYAAVHALLLPLAGVHLQLPEFVKSPPMVSHRSTDLMQKCWAAAP